MKNKSLYRSLELIFGHNVDCGVTMNKQCDCPVSEAMQTIKNRDCQIMGLIKDSKLADKMLRVLEASY